MARFLVTGGAGFIGSHLVHALLEDGHAVRVLDDLSSGCRKNLPQQAELAEADVTDTAAVESAIDDVDGCFHLAAIASVARSHRDWLRSHQVNLTGTINVFDRARPSRRRREVPVVYASRALRSTGIAAASRSTRRAPQPRSVHMAPTSMHVNSTPVSPARYTGYRR
jgi:UDP-glucose 4-epimerase